MTNARDYTKWLVKDYDFRWESSGRLVSCGVTGYVPDRELGFFHDVVGVYDRLAPLLADTDFHDRFTKFIQTV